MKKKPEEATTTHPMMIRVLGDVLVSYGAKVIVGDSQEVLLTRKF